MLVIACRTAAISVADRLEITVLKVFFEVPCEAFLKLLDACLPPSIAAVACCWTADSATKGETISSKK